MSDHDDFSFEPLPGLPAHPPKGETLLWQGRPSSWALAWQAYGLRWIVGYFAVLALWRGWIGIGEAGLSGALTQALPFLILGLIAAAIVLAMATVQARSTVYTITTSRVAMRIGAALTVTLNIPFTQIASASLDLRRGGTGNIALQTQGETQLSYAVCWPHVRPWHVTKTEPTLRCIPDAERIARLLSEAAETRLSQPIVSQAPNFAAVAAE